MRSGGEIVDLQRGQQRLGALAHRAPVEAAAEAARGVAHEDVLRDGQLGKQQQLLIDRRDAGAARVLGQVELALDAVDQDLPAVGRKHAGDDLDQRRFARAVLAEQRVNFARRDRERNVRRARARRERSSRGRAPRAEGRATSGLRSCGRRRVDADFDDVDRDRRLRAASRARTAERGIGDRRARRATAGRRRDCRARRIWRNRPARSVRAPAPAACARRARSADGPR